MHPSRTSRRALSLLLTFYGVLAFWMSVYVPPFEAPDAYFHFAVIEHIARTDTLPPRDNAAQHAWQQMAFHAPLYYMSAAALISPLDTRDFAHDYRVNPHAALGSPESDGNKNDVVSAADPQGGTAWALRIVRAYSVLLGALTVISVYGITRVIAPQRLTLALIAAMLTAFNPQFVFIHTTPSNDTLVTALSSLALWLMVSQVRHGVTVRGVALLSVLMAAAALTKTSGLALYPSVAAGLAWACWRDRVPLRRVMLYALIGFAAFGVIAGWWYVWNWQTLGDMTANAQVAAVTGARATPPTWAELLFELGGILYSFWGVFGWFNITAPPLYYTLILLMSGIAAAGLAWGAWCERARLHRLGAMWGVLLLHLALFCAAWFSFHLQVNAAQGRLFFPLLVILMPLMAYGLSQWARLVPAIALTSLFLSVLLIPPLVIAPEYRGEAPRLAESFRPPPDAHAFIFREPWQHDACLTLWTGGADWDGVSPITVELWWQPTCALSGYWSVFLHFVDTTRETCLAGDTAYVLAQADTMPQRGALPVPAMQIGHVYHDSITVTPPPNLDTSRAWHIQLGLYDAGGTFMRAFVQGADDTHIGRCAPETVQFRVW